MIGRLVVCGVGLIGGSFAKALRQAGVVGEIVGMGRTRRALETALDAGVVDRICTDWAEALDGADMVLLGTPVGALDALLGALAPHLQPGTVLSDVGSTKSDVAAVFRQHLSAAQLVWAVPAHPIAGAERSGVEAAFATLYQGRKLVLTPLAENCAEAVERVRSAWLACGAVVTEMTPQDHDRVFAAVSHLPHLLAFGLVHDLAGRDNAGQLFDYAASGFRDFTRIAASHPEMWRDICLANRSALLDEMDAYVDVLTRMRALLAAGDAAGLEQIFDDARRARMAWGERFAAQ